MSLKTLFASRAGRMKASEIRELLKLLNRPGILSFAGGIPDPALFPAEAFRAATARALADDAVGQSLQYSTSEGNPRLRAWIASYMTKIGAPCSEENILITSGSQQALDYLGKLFLSPNDTALVGWPTYLGALGAFNAYEPHYDRLDPSDNRSPATLAEAATAAGGRLKFSYVTPDFSNPTGMTLTKAQREALIDQADALDIAILEDSAYYALRFDGDDVLPILALEIARKGSIEACRTVYCGSFSKTLAPGLRVGWVCAAQPVISQLVLIKQAGDLHSATLNQAVVAEIAETSLDTHLPKLRAHYAKRRDTMLDALQRYMPPGVSWTKPEGGMFVWMTLPKGHDGADLLATALETQNIAFVPGSAFFPDGSGRNTLRLNFSSPNETQIEEGMRRLGLLLTA
jgi:DNA-binding transcriptional MocR family regulator